MSNSNHAYLYALAAAALMATGPLAAAPGDQAVQPLPQISVSADAAGRTRSAHLPAHGMFVGDQLSASARAKFTDLIIDAIGLRVEVALVVPTGPWQIDGSGKDERDLTPARLQSVRRFLAERGIDPKRIYVESRTDTRVKEPRMELQLVGTPASD